MKMRKNNDPGYEDEDQLEEKQNELTNRVF
jgi:hypothetical protein